MAVLPNRQIHQTRWLARQPTVKAAIIHKRPLQRATACLRRGAMLPARRPLTQALTTAHRPSPPRLHRPKTKHKRAIRASPLSKIRSPSLAIGRSAILTQRTALTCKTVHPSRPFHRIWSARNHKRATLRPHAWEVEEAMVRVAEIRPVRMSVLAVQLGSLAPVADCVG